MWMRLLQRLAGGLPATAAVLPLPDMQGARAAARSVRPPLVRVPRQLELDLRVAQRPRRQVDVQGERAGSGG
jgi:hypothetical protein